MAKPKICNERKKYIFNLNRTHTSRLVVMSCIHRADSPIAQLAPIGVWGVTYFPCPSSTSSSPEKSQPATKRFSLIECLFSIKSDSTPFYTTGWIVSSLGMLEAEKVPFHMQWDCLFPHVCLFYKVTQVFEMNHEVFVTIFVLWTFRESYSIERCKGIPSLLEGLAYVKLSFRS